MPYSNTTNPMMQPQANNNWWFGNNYSSGYSQASRSQVQPQPYGMPYLGMTPMQPVPQMQPQMQPSQPEPQTLNNVIQVSGPESADGFRVGPNSHVVLMDASNPIMYKKDSDDTGYAKTRAFAFYEIPLYPVQQQAEAPAQTTSEPTLTKDDIVEIIKSTIGPWQKSIEELVINNA